MSTAGRISPIGALIAGLIAGGSGLGYLYVSRIGLAIVVVAAYFVLMALSGWTRLILIPYTIYVLFGLMLLVTAIALVHPVVIAIRRRTIHRKSYNRWWVYIVWLAGFFALFGVVATNRAVLFGFEPFRIPAPIRGSSMLSEL